MFNEIDFLSGSIIAIGVIAIILLQTHFWVLTKRLYKAGTMSGLEVPILFILNLFLITPLRIIGIIISLLLFNVPIIFQIIIGFFGFSIVNDMYLIIVFIEKWIFPPIEDWIYINIFLRKNKNSSL